jgi:hypothetical protein
MIDVNVSEKNYFESFPAFFQNKILLKSLLLKCNRTYIDHLYKFKTN